MRMWNITTEICTHQQASSFNISKLTIAASSETAILYAKLPNQNHGRQPVDSEHIRNAVGDNFS